jgi:Ca-activated chloride channel family protein
MDGIKIEKTRAALKKCLGQIKTGDTFTLMRFGSRYSAMTAGLLDATPDNLNAGAAYIDRLDADDGGTVIGAPLLHALSAYGDGVTVILVTDGQIGGEQTLISEVRGVIGQSRLFIFGIDSAVNDDGLTRLAQAGHGKAEFIVPDERLDDKIVRQFARINGAGCATVRLDVGVNAVKDVLKSGGALFNHEYWWSFVKLKAVKGGFGLCCTVNGKEYRTELPLAQIRQTQLAVDKQYALQKVRQIEAYIARNRYGNDDGSTESYEKQIVEIAVRYHVATKYTSFLAVNERDGKIFDVPAQEQIALDLPSGWNRTSDEFYTIDYCYCPAKPAYAPRFSLSPMPAPLQGSAPVQTSALPTPAYEPALGRGITENSVVTVRFTGNGREKTVVIRAAGYTGPAIASAEAISIDSPFAQALLGKKEGADFFYTSELGIVYTGTIEKVIAAPETTQNDGARPQKG